MRKLIAAMKASLDGKIERTDGPADWVTAWSDDYGLTPQIDACILGGGMYQLYEPHCTSYQTDPGKPNPITGTLPTPAELMGCICSANAALRAFELQGICGVAQYKVHQKPRRHRRAQESAR